MIKCNSDLENFSKWEQLSCVSNCKLVPFSSKVFILYNDLSIHWSRHLIIFFFFFFSIGLQVLIESKQLRREAKDSGPLMELDNWKYMSAKLNFIIEQIKGQNCKAVINVLKVAKSKVLKVIFFFFMPFFYYKDYCFVLFCFIFISSKRYLLRRIKRGKFRSVAGVAECIQTKYKTFQGYSQKLT